MSAALANNVSDNNISLSSPTAGHEQQEMQSLCFGKSEHKLKRVQRSWGRREERDKMALEGLVQEGGLKVVGFLKLELKKTDRGAENSLQIYKRLIYKKKGDEEPGSIHWLSL